MENTNSACMGLFAESLILHTSSRYSTSYKTVNGIIYRDMLELLLMHQLREDEINVILKHPGHYHISTIRRQHSFTGNCLTDDKAQKGRFLTSTISRYEPCQCYVRLCERRGLRSTKTHNPAQLEGSNTNRNCKCKQPLLQNIWQGVKYIFFICGRRQEEHILTYKGYCKSSSIWSVKRRSFNFLWLLLSHQFLFVIAHSFLITLYFSQNFVSKHSLSMCLYWKDTANFKPIQNKTGNAIYIYIYIYI